MHQIQRPIDHEPTPRTDAILAQILAAVECGEAIDLEQEIANHPDIAQELRAALIALHRGLDAMRLVVGVAAPFPERIGDYQLTWRIGKGGEGASVFRAIRLPGQEVVALKVLPPAGDPRQTRRFVMQQQFAALHHRNIVPVLDAGEVDSFHFLAMELMACGTAAALLSGIRSADREAGGDPTKRPHSPGVGARIPLPWPLRPEDPTYVRWAVTVACGVAQALQEAHRSGLLHRDIKPSNILLAADGTARLADFGLARSTTGSDLTRTGETPGTRPYMSPEQLDASGKIDERTDLYSLGATLFELLTLRRPLEDPARPSLTDTELIDRIRYVRPVDARKLNPAVPADLAALVASLLEKVPEDRPASAASVAQDLERFLAGRAMKARPLRWPRRAMRLARRHPRATAIVSALSVTIGIALSFAAAAARENAVILLDRQRLNRRAVEASLRGYTDAKGGGDWTRRQVAAALAQESLLGLLRLQNDPADIDASLCDLADLLLEQGNTHEAGNVLQEAAGSDHDPRLQARVAALRSRLKLLQEPKRAADLLDSQAKLLAAQDGEQSRSVARTARIVRQLVQHRVIEAPGMVDTAAAWESEPVPCVNADGGIGLWQWQVGMRMVARLPEEQASYWRKPHGPWSSVLLVQPGTAGSGSTAPAYHCLLCVGNRLWRFTVTSDQSAPSGCVDIDEAIISPQDQSLVASLHVLDVDALRRPVTVYVAKRGGAEAINSDDALVDFSCSRATVVPSLRIRAATTAFVPLAGDPMRYVLGLGEWSGFGFAFVERAESGLSPLGLQRVGYVSDLATLTNSGAGSGTFLASKGTAWHSSSLFEARQRKEWQTGVHLVRLTSQPELRLERLCGDVDFDDRWRWTINVVPEVRPSGPDDGLVHVAVCTTEERSDSEVRVYAASGPVQTSDGGGLALLARFTSPMPFGFGLLKRNLDRNPDDEILLAHGRWADRRDAYQIDVLGLEDQP